MSWLIPAVLGVVVGVVTGLVFFGGLWWTSHRLVTSERPGLVMATSLLVRMLLLTTTLVLLARADTVVFVCAVVGVVVSRMVLTRAAVRDRLPEPNIRRMSETSE